ncbi:MAG: aldo/keto reductase [Oscillospiraceae bacterium]
MIYKQFKELKLSSLGMGTMRLPVMGGNNGQIDEEATAKMVAAAIEHGINYFDTAWMYHDYTSEVVIGKILSKYPRESYYLATKFPGMDPANMNRAAEIFEKQLEKCQVDFFDFYLIHNVCEKNIDAYLDEDNDVIPYLLKQKENGRIRHLGFSVHGSFETMKRFLDRWGKQMEFCQIQLNYIDWSLQKACDKVALLNELNIPIWVMEPLRGGKLAALSEENTAKLKHLRPEEGIPAWGFRFLQSIPGVTMILSGMSDYNQVMDNLHTFETNRPLTEDEMSVLTEIATEMRGGVSCTACRYCTAYCPMGLEIPDLLSLYNELSFSNDAFLPKMHLSKIPAEKQPSSCIGCRRCETVCPQEIKISEALADFVSKILV